MGDARTTHSPGTGSMNSWTPDSAASSLVVARSTTQRGTVMRKEGLGEKEEGRRAVSGEGIPVYLTHRKLLGEHKAKRLELSIEMGQGGASASARGPFQHRYRPSEIGPRVSTGANRLTTDAWSLYVAHTSWHGRGERPPHTFTTDGLPF